MKAILSQQLSEVT